MSGDESEDRGEDHRLNHGAYVRFDQVEGMTKLNGQSYEVENVKKLQLQIKFDTRNFTEYASVSRSGSGKQEFQPHTLSLLPFVDVLKDPSTRGLTHDWTAFGQDKHVVLAFVAAQRASER
jgi:hypothetical protein